MEIVQILVWILYAYLLIGLIVGSWVVFAGITRIDPNMKESSWRTRLILLPGTVALWPVLLRKYLNTQQK